MKPWTKDSVSARDNNEAEWSLITHVQDPQKKKEKKPNQQNSSIFLEMLAVDY